MIAEIQPQTDFVEQTLSLPRRDSSRRSRSTQSVCPSVGQTIVFCGLPYICDRPVDRSAGDLVAGGFYMN
jgi:hypothetical protein